MGGDEADPRALTFNRAQETNAWEITLRWLLVLSVVVTFSGVKGSSSHPHNKWELEKGDPSSYSCVPSPTPILHTVTI